MLVQQHSFVCMSISKRWLTWAVIINRLRSSQFTSSCCTRRSISLNRLIRCHVFVVVYVSRCRRRPQTLVGTAIEGHNLILALMKTSPTLKFWHPAVSWYCSVAKKSAICRTFWSLLGSYNNRGAAKSRNSIFHLSVFGKYTLNWSRPLGTVITISESSQSSGYWISETHTDNRCGGRAVRSVSPSPEQSRRRIEHGT